LPNAPIASIDRNRPVLTGAQVRALRVKIGWTLAYTAFLLGYRGKDPTQWLSAIETEARGRHLSYAQANLLLAIAEGYTPVHYVEEAEAKAPASRRVTRKVPLD
jgi:hypothetical protein